MELDQKELMFHCVAVLDTFDPDSKAMEAHVNGYLKYQQVRFYMWYDCISTFR